MNTFFDINLKGTLKLNEPMKFHTSWKVGGPAEYLYIPKDFVDLENLLTNLKIDIKKTFVGLGSNLLVRDEGIKGLVIKTFPSLKNIRLKGRDSLYVESGVSSPKVAKFASKNNIEGLEFLAGIPGTIGGALAMNAGCYGKEIWDHVEKVFIADTKGNLYTKNNKEFDISYREVKNKKINEYFFLAAEIKSIVGSKIDSQNKIKKLSNDRKKKQPLDKYNAGSVFRNPKGEFAARLIEISNLKGFKIGGASVSQKHANFIINDGTANASEIERLIKHIEKTVFKSTGIKLKREIKIIGGNQYV